ncbi:hypothetical protein EVAR_7919_1 [Eumeta japonica]|uniref:Uncharacterized protein n=1 Tax=Eumeta variegata TaxID=151549 RepID=A0A4C1TW91_EUMVA|nr:hypothetical protein EVAR_7919_1 [Eumeta japonica]
MEQIFMLEILVDKISIFFEDECDKSGNAKRLIIKIKFGPKVEFIIVEGQIVNEKELTDDIIECDEYGHRKWTRIIRIGRSLLFPSYPDKLINIFAQFPLNIEVWNDDMNEDPNIFVGVGTMLWDKRFIQFLKNTDMACLRVEPLTVKQVTRIMADCNCKQTGEVVLINRLSALGESIITDYQQLAIDPDSILFRTNKVPSVIQGKRFRGDDENFTNVGIIYESVTLEDPDVVDAAHKRLEICTGRLPCTARRESSAVLGKSQKADVTKIRMGDISGPCGNRNCPLAHKVKMYIRNLDAYKKEAVDVTTEKEVSKSKNICGSCPCKEDRWYTETNESKVCSAKAAKPYAVCQLCGGATAYGQTCCDRLSKFDETTTVNYFFHPSRLTRTALSLPNVKVEESKDSLLRSCCRGADQLIDSWDDWDDEQIEDNSCDKFGTASNTDSINKNFFVYYCFPNSPCQQKGAPCVRPRNKACNCETENDSIMPPCDTPACRCLQKKIDAANRKAHRPYCPAYKHKEVCPVLKENQDSGDEDEKVEGEQEVETTAYGVPPIQLSSCRAPGKPCSSAASVTKPTKFGAFTTSKPKVVPVHCSAEYERIRQALKDYYARAKEHDLKCMSRYNRDLENLCCDTEPRYTANPGKGCCDDHVPC